MLKVSGYPIKEEIAESMARCNAEITKANEELRYLAKVFIEGNFYMSPKEVAEYLRCSEEDIPKMKRYRLGTTKILYKREDVDAFLKSKIIGVKND